MRALLLCRLVLDLNAPSVPRFGRGGMSNGGDGFCARSVRFRPPPRTYRFCSCTVVVFLGLEVLHLACCLLFFLFFFNYRWQKDVW